MITIALPPGVDATALMNQLLSYGAIIVPVVAIVGGFFLAAKILRRV